MEFEKTNDHDPGEYLAFVAWLVDVTAESLKVARGDPERLRAAVDDYLKRGYSARLTSGELTDFFCTDSPSILDRAGYGDRETDEAVKVFDDLNTRRHNAFEALLRLGSEDLSGVYLRAPCDGQTLRELGSLARQICGEKLSAELVRFYSISDGCQISNAYFRKARDLLGRLGLGTSGMILLGEDGTAYFVIDPEDKRCHMLLEGGDEKFKSFESFRGLLLVVMQEQGVI